jgi:hypothetical protein
MSLCARIALPLLALILLACSGASNDPDPSLTLIPPADLEAYRARLGPDLWREIEAQSWYKSGAATADGARLLATLANLGPLASSQDRLHILSLYPQGLPEEVPAVVSDYTRATFLAPHEVLQQVWLADGLDDYERSVFSLLDERALPAQSVRSALEAGLFRSAFDADPDNLTIELVEALGSLHPQVDAYVRSQPWSRDGFSAAELSLLAVLSDYVSVPEQLAILESGRYRPLPLRSGDIAVVLRGDDTKLVNQGFAAIATWAQEVEDFVGPFRPPGLILNVADDPNALFCHGAGGSEYEAGFIDFTSARCLVDFAVVHELAHAFIGGRYPVWFTEGVAELATYHVLGDRWSYLEGSGQIQIEGVYSLNNPAYANQAGLGARFLVEVSNLIGPENASRFVASIAGLRLTGRELLDRLRQASPPAIRLDLDRLIAASF